MKFLWNLFRLVLALGFFGVLVAAVIYLVRGQMQVVSGLASVMSLLFFSINVTNFRQYRWDETGTGAKAVILAPVVLSVGALIVSAMFPVPIGFGVLGVIVVFWFLVTRRRPDLRFSRVPIRLKVGDENVELAYANMTLDAIRWDEIVRIAVTTEAEGPVEDDFYFFLEPDETEEDGGCIIPQIYAGELRDRIRRLEDFDEGKVYEAVEADDGEPRVLWKGNPGRARICGDDES